MSTVLETLADVTNGAESALVRPYRAEIEVQGTAPLLFHAWNVESVEAKSKAAKGSAVKKSDDLESYVYRDLNGNIAIPSEYFRMTAVEAARYLQDPRSPRKSARDLFKAGIVVGPTLCSLGTKEWDYLDKRRVTIQRSGITRSRPAMNENWKCSFLVDVLVPEYISPTQLNDAYQMAGRLVGVGDFRPTFGRFQVVYFKVHKS